MRKIALIGCSKKKLGVNTPQTTYRAGEIYIGNNFRKSRDEGIEYFGCESDFYILSGNVEYGLLNCNDMICYYDKYLGNCTAKERKIWANKILQQLKCKFDISDTEFVIFAGSAYSQYIKNYLNCIILKFNSRTITFEIKEKLSNGSK